jgi:hypothetical protein
MKHHRRTLAAIGLSLSIAACSLVVPPLSVAAGKIKVSFSIATRRSPERFDVVQLTNHERYCVRYYFQSYGKTGVRDSNYGDEIRAGQTRYFEADPINEGDRSFMKFYRCGHSKVILATVHFVFARGYHYSPPIRSASRASASASPSHGTLRPQTILDAIHQALHSGDRTQNRNCRFGGSNPFPNVPCRHDHILPTSAFSTPSAGGFTADCKNPYISTFHYYELTTGGLRFSTCGPLGVWGPRKSRLGQFQRPLNNVGRTIEASIGVSYDEPPTRIGGNRRATTAIYQCPASGQPGVREIRIRRDGTTALTPC